MEINLKFKENNSIKWIYSNIKTIGMSSLTKISPVVSSKILYSIRFKKNLNLKEPKTYNEKLMWLKLYWREPLKSKCADKYGVREYIRNLGEDKCLNDLYNVYSKTEDIIWEDLPKSFVLKVTNTCGANIICDDKANLDKKETLKKLNKWMNEKFYLRAAEMQYKNITPKIICEKYLKPQNGFLPIDYKIYCFNGEAKVIMLCTDRETGNPKFYLCDMNGEILPFNRTGIESINNGIKKIKLPSTIDEMCRLSKKLSSPFPFVRMDFYDHDGNVIFGEMTFTPAACLDHNITEQGEQIMGEWINLPSSTII